MSRIFCARSVIVLKIVIRASCVTTASNAEQAEQLVQRDVFDLCFLDLRLGESSGLDLLPALRQYAPWMKVVIVTAHSSIDSALDAIRAGAVDYLVKPCTPEQLRMTATKQIQARRLEQRVEALEKEDCATSSAEMDSESPAMKKVLETLRQVADTDATVLILGESGTGKGVAARTVHHCSPRAKERFVTVNCPSLSAELLESELFGHKKGAFTGATENKLGRVDQADGGTLDVLDEVGDVPLALQLKFIALHPGSRIRTRGRSSDSPRECAHRRGDQPRSGGNGEAGPVPRRSSLSPQRDQHLHAAAARTPGRSAASGRDALPSALCSEIIVVRRAFVQQVAARWTPFGHTHGRAISANCRTSSSAASSSVPGAEIDVAMLTIQESALNASRVRASAMPSAWRNSNATHILRRARDQLVAGSGGHDPGHRRLYPLSQTQAI